MIQNGPDQDDTISVRKDEQFDENKLHEFLRDKLNGAQLSLKVRQFGGGAANLTYLIQFGTDDHEYVLRRPPLGPLAKSSHDMGREYKVLSVLYKLFPYAPQAYLYCEDSSIIGAPFFVMERKKGFVIRTKFPEHYNQIPHVARKISEALIDRLAEFHAIDYHALKLDDLGHPEGFIERQIEGWHRRWQNAKVENLEEMEQIYKWLKENIPTMQRYTLVHNDYKLDNVMLDYNDPSKIVAIFDWDMCTLGNPLSDLGSLLAWWSDPDDPPELREISFMPQGNFDFLTRKELVKRYEQTSGYPVTDIDFYHILGIFRIVVIAAQIYIRYVRKQTQDKRFAALGLMVPKLAHNAVTLIQKNYK